MTPLAPLVERLAQPGPLVTVELRPPRSGLDPARSMDVWIDMYHTVQRLARKDILVFLTDNAVGDMEEESLAHLGANLAGDVGMEHIVPFLTTKHSLEYCLLFARRAVGLGVAGLTVLGGDKEVGPPRCVPHGKDLRRLIREEIPDLPLGGWANPNADIERQLDFVSDPAFEADFILTQVVSHHALDRVEAFAAGLEERGIDLPVVWGVFYYRSASRKTLEILNQFFPVPVAELEAEFAEGHSPEEICRRTIHGLRSVGADKIYVSNLGARGGARRLAQIMTGLEP